MTAEDSCVGAQQQRILVSLVDEVPLGVAYRLQSWQTVVV